MGTLKKLYQKDPVIFAVVWIVIYVLVFSNADSLSESIGIPKLLTVFAGLALSSLLLGFLRKNSLFPYCGLQKVQAGKGFVWLLPLVIISSVNFWNGLTLHMPAGETVLYILSMCCVGFLEEVIFRGLLFKGMSKSSITVAIIVSSLTFGMGHIINLLLGEPILDTLLQLVYASAIGFCYTAVFHISGSILPCIVSHAFVNSTSVFAVEPGATGQILIAAIQTVLGVGYGLWLLRKSCQKQGVGL